LTLLSRLRSNVGWAAIALGLVCAAPLAAAEPLAEQPQSTIGYPSPEAALAALRAKPGVEFSTQDGWTIANDAATNTVWSFPPEHDPAYPAVVRRQMAPAKGGGVAVQMDVMCSASKTACDDLVRAFERMNDEVKAQLQGGD
jgi:hypothetical protein